ncbi:hypothetical protein N7452_010030 [Penicillium brevicompactum]|uniref:protein acetyllysine N-acetyltransferase n=1 Tax=Penicillium brevicompactum TaxID=5074 RepID=A0A9W9Q9S2_PENBR|nr:hypothetical protein N7452_010030 [Penicillium brevicompactum]
MANNAPKVAAKERREPMAAVDKKAAILVSQIKSSRHFIAFTGAGVSTSAGIPDFRGPDGNWTMRAQGKQTKTANTLQAIPTLSHMALVELQNREGAGFCRPEMISELHGNSNREYCKDCDKEYMRDFRAVSNYENGDHDHHTGRKCVLCGGVLLDSIVNFDENLPARDLDLARENAQKADLFLVLGSSLTVTPAKGIPEIVGQKEDAKLAICNLQQTPIDDLTSICIFTEADILMERVMNMLGLPIPTFTLRRHLVVDVETQDDRHRMTLTGVESDGTPMTFLQSVRLEGTRRVVRAEPFTIQVRDALEPGAELKFELEFMGHYNEPNLELVHPYNGSGKGFYLLEYNPLNGAWVVERRASFSKSMPTTDI